VGSGFDGQQVCQGKFSPGIADVGVVARGVHVLMDSSLSPRMYGRGMQGMVGRSVGEFARLIVVRDKLVRSSELAGAKSWVS
jgi:hypothetical protein